LVDVAYRHCSHSRVCVGVLEEQEMFCSLIAVLIAQAVYTYVVAGGSHENSD
jgi:hypothetical protein